MNSKTYLFAIYIFLVITGCSKSELKPKSTNYFGSAFTIKLHEVAVLSPIHLNNSSTDSIMTISFDSILNESRLPKSSCYLGYASTAKIKISFTQQNKLTTLNLTILGCQDEYQCDDLLYYHVDTLGYRFCFLRLDPYPTSGAIVNSSNYTAKLNVSKL